MVADLAVRRNTLARYGLAEFWFSVVEAEQHPAGMPNWVVRIDATTGRSERLDVGLADRLAADLRRIGEVSDAQKVEVAAEEARRQMRPKPDRANQK